MGDLRILDFDLLGNLPQNKIDREEIPLKDKTCPWVIPNGSPFFANNVRVFNEKGGELKQDRDFFLEGEFIPFCEMTGKSVVSFIRLSDLIRANNKKVFVSYQSIGAWFIPRNDLEDWLKKVQEGVVPLDWSRVFGLPDTFPPSYHIHDIITEIGDWYELSFIFQYLANIRLTRNKDLSTDIDQVLTDVYQKLEAKRDEQHGILKAHDANYANPHGADKNVIGAGNILNVPTAKEADMASKSDQFYVTPLQARLRVESTTNDTDVLLKKGAMPVSLLGGGDFIPPTIDGSFEGIGSDNESTGFCLENNGRLMLLTRHFDGRNAALFFSFVDNYRNTGNLNGIIFTGFKYTNQFIAADGVEADTIVAGSNHKVLMVGVKNTDKWYLCLTNGTFDPASHSFVKVDMTNVNLKAYDSPNNPTYYSDTKATVHRLGDWIYLIQSTNLRGNGDNGAQYFFRVKVADVLAGRNVSWEHVKLTYVDYDGVQRTNFDYFFMLTPVYDANNRLTRAGYIYNPPQDTYSGFYRKFVAYSGEHPTDRNRANLHMVGHTFLTVVRNGQSYSNGPDIDIAYEINPTTGNMVLQDKAPLVTIDENSVCRDPASGVIVPGPCPYGADMTFSSGQSATVLLPNGDLVNSNGFDSAKTYPRTFLVQYAPGVTNDWEHCRRSLFVMSNIAGITRYRQASIIASPLKSNTYPGCLSYSSDGEVYTALNQNDNGRSMFFKKVTGPYAQRDEVKMKNYPGAISRPLTNDVYKANIPPWMTLINMTGPASQLAAAGREMGDMGMSVAKFVNMNPMGNDGIFQGRVDGIDLCWPKNFSRVLNQDKTADYTVERFYGINPSQLQALYNTHTPGSSKDKACTIAMFPAENGPMFNGIAIGLMAFVYYVGNSTTRVRTLTFKATIEAANAAHPRVDLITAFQVLATADEIVHTNVVDGSFGIGVQYGTMVPNLQCYRNGNSMDFYWYTSFQYSVVGNTNIAACKGTVNLTTGALTNYEALPSNWLPDTSNRQAVPNYGLCPNLFVNSGSSPSAQVCQSTDGSGNVTTIVLATTYPSPLWSVFFKEGTRVIINGTKYMLPIGIVDLRDIDPDPRNKTFYIYVTVDENGAKYIITRNRLRHNNFLLPAATVVCGEKQVLRIDTRQPFMVGDLILQAGREGGSIPASTGLPMDEGSFRYVYQHDLS